MSARLRIGPTSRLARCRAPVPLGFADQTACLRCHTVIPLPEDLRSRRDNFRKVEAERRHADPLWQMVLSAHSHVYRRPLLLASMAYMAPFVGIIVGYVFAYRHGQYGLAALFVAVGDRRVSSSVFAAASASQTALRAPADDGAVWQRAFATAGLSGLCIPAFRAATDRGFAAFI